MGQVLSNQDQASLRRDLSVASSTYSEILAPWEVRGGQDLGLLGVSLAQTFMARANQITQVQIFLLVVSVLLLVILIGLLVANQITRPLLKVVDASSQVARGNLDVKVEPRGNDEVTVLARSFNTMVAGLQEGSIYRDLLGRTVSPEVREQLRQTFLSGSLHLEGQEAVATVLMTDIRGFTTLSEHVDPAEVFRWLNEYFGELVPIVTANGGVVNKFDGDAMLAFFGILPSMQNLQQSAYAACTTAVSILKAIEQVNTRRVGRGAPPLATGIGINSGPVTAGSLGASDRLHYTIIGDTVNAAQRLEALTRQILDASGVLVGQSTYQALGELSYKFHFQPLGVHPIKGKSDQMEVYRLLADEPSGSPGRSG
jgi:adenylate cyclase